MKLKLWQKRWKSLVCKGYSDFKSVAPGAQGFAGAIDLSNVVKMYKKCQNLFNFGQKMFKYV